MGGAGQYGAAPGYQQPRPIGGGYAGPQMGYQGVQLGPMSAAQPSVHICTQRERALFNGVASLSTCFLHSHSSSSVL